MNTLRQLLKRVLPYRVVRAPAGPSFPAVPANEKAEIDRILAAFAQETGADARAWRGYLSDDRIGFFQALVGRFSDLGVSIASARIADIGSGTGYLCRVLRQQGANGEIFGFETFEDPLPLARRLCPDGQFQVRSLFDIQDRFDVVLCTEVLEHLVRPADAIAQMAGLLEPGGALIVTVPNGRHDTQGAGQIRDDGTAYWGHIHFWSPESWALFLDDAAPSGVETDCGTLAFEHLFGILRKS